MQKRAELPFFVQLWAVILVLPFFGLLRESLISHGSDRSVWVALQDPVIHSIAGFTLFQAFLSLLLAGVLGVPLGLWFSTAFRTHFRRGFEILLALPMGIPGLVTASAAVAWIGRQGLLTQIGLWPEAWAYSGYAVIAVHGCWNASWIALKVAQKRASIPLERMEAARVLGANRYQRFLLLDLPELRTELFWSSLQVFQLCASSFVIVLLLGGGPPVETLETAIYSKVRLAELDFPGAVACVFLQIGIVALPGLTGLFYQWRKMLKQSLSEAQWVASSRVISVGKTRLGLQFVGAAFLGLLPWLLAFDRQAVLKALEWLPLKEARESIALSIQLASGSLLLSGVLAALLLRAARQNRGRTQPWVILTALFPSWISPFILGLGFWLAAERWIDPFADNWQWVILIQAILGVPFLFRALWPVVGSPQLRLMDSARTLGATPLRAFWTVEWPRWKGVVATAGGVYFFGAIGDLAAMSFFAGGAFESGVPLPVVVSRMISHYQFDEAQGVLWVLVGLGLSSLLVLSGVLSLTGWIFPLGMDFLKQRGWRRGGVG
jgi:thiamine transport system permease protein